MEQLRYISLKNVTGNSSLSTQVTVALFNTVRSIETDSKGRKYIEVAIKPHLFGVLVRREYLNK